MQRMMLLTLFCLLSICSLSGCSSKNSDAGDIAEALEDRLADALNFEGGTLKDGEPPDSSDSPDAPQITELIAPKELVPGASFVVILRTDFDKPKTVNKAVIRVKKATKHILISGELVFKPEGWTMELSGVLDNVDVAGSFTLEYALQTKDGVTGAYRSGDVAVEAQNEKAECEPGPCCNGGAWVDNGAPCVSGRDDNNCTEDLCDAAHACEAETLTDGAACFIDDTQTQGVCNNAMCLAETVSDGDTEIPPPGFVPITAGTFIMGSPDGVNCPPDVPGCNIADYPAELGRETNETQHEVTLTYDFELSRYEITQGEFTALMGWNPSYFGPNGGGAICGDNCPVETVSWYDAAAYANELSLDAGLTPCYVFSGVGCVDSTDVNANYMDCMNATQGGVEDAMVELNGVTKPQNCEGYRLPTEAEWEFAARAGSRTAFHPSDGNDGTITYTDCTLDTNLDQIGWYCGNDNTATKPGGGKEPNAWGLYDMSGNVYEWGWDWWDGNSDYGTGSVTDPAGQETSSTRVLRGGYWFTSTDYCRSAHRSGTGPYNRHNYTGIRVARSIN